MTRFRALFALCATAAALLFAGTAHADPYGFDFTLAGQLSPGGSTQVHAEGFVPGATVELSIVWTSTSAFTGQTNALRSEALVTNKLVLANLVADKDGVVDTVITVPNGPTGKTTIRVAGPAAAGGEKVATFSLTVSAVASAGPVPGGSGSSSGSKSGSGSGLPTTGSDTASPLSIGGGFLALGAVAVAASRVRRRRIAA